MSRYPESFWSLVVERAAADPHHVVLADDYGRSLTRAQLRDRAESVAAALAAEGVGPGTVVSWQLPTTLEAMVLLVALSRLGAVQNPLVPILREREVRFITAQIDTEVLIVPERWRGFAFGEMARSIAADGGFRVHAVELEQPVQPDALLLPEADPGTLSPPVADGAAVRWIYYSSGTTSDPKGARHSDQTIMHSASGLVDGIEFGPTDVYPIAWPVSHIGGATVLVASLVSGLRMVLFDSFDPARTPECMAAHRPTLLGTALPFFRAFMDAQRRNDGEPLFPKVRCGMWGGAALPAEIHDEVLAELGLHCVGSWGLTEFPISTSASPHDPPHVLRTSVGKASPGVSIRVVGLDGVDRGVGEEGEFWLQGPQMCLGYVDPALDRDGFVDGWFRTGDLGHVDEHGYVYITGRAKDVIIRNAENISALEVEDALRRHPGVSDVAVIGLPDARTGERVCAVIVPNEGHQLDVATLAQHCQSLGLAKQKCPEQVEVVAELPHNPMGKVLKQALRDRYKG